MEEMKIECAFSLFCALDTNQIATYFTRNVPALNFLAWGRAFCAALGVLLNALRIRFLVLTIFDRGNVLRCASSLGAAYALLVLAF